MKLTKLSDSAPAVKAEIDNSEFSLKSLGVVDALQDIFQLKRIRLLQSPLPVR